MLKSIYYLVNKYFMMAAKKTENLLERGAGVENLIHIEDDSVYK